MVGVRDGIGVKVTQRQTVRVGDKDFEGVRVIVGVRVMVGVSVMVGVRVMVGLFAGVPGLLVGAGVPTGGRVKDWVTTPGALVPTGWMVALDADCVAVNCETGVSVGAGGI